MKNFDPQKIKNEEILSYLKDSRERIELEQEITRLKNDHVEIPMYIGGKDYVSGIFDEIRAPHDYRQVLGIHHVGRDIDVKRAIRASMQAKSYWAGLNPEERASIFLKAADLISGPYRAKINAATMLGQSKTVFQAEIDSACELADFFRYNVKFMYDIMHNSPFSPDGISNEFDWRPLEGFVLAITPFNFTSIAGNLPTAPALMGNTVVWKPSKNQILSAHVIIEALKEAGLPDGVINAVYADGSRMGDVIFTNPDFSGFHFTGSTEVFTHIWQVIAKNLRMYRSFPRIVGETGGKDFVFVHVSADVQEVVTALVRGAYEYQGQKCSAASRAYLPKSLWSGIKDNLIETVRELKMGTPEDYSNFINAVIDKKAFNRIRNKLEQVKKNNDLKILIGGNANDETGYFIQPTVIESKDPLSFAMTEELFAPVLTVFVYDDTKLDETLELCDNTSEYGLTGSVFAKDKKAVEYISSKLRNAAGNFYINDKPTGAVVNQQPFGGARKSGTNDKAGSFLNLIRWTSPRVIKENFNPPTNYQYPYMDS